MRNRRSGGGFVGVDVFFVLSGYLITGLLVAEVERTSRLNLLQFYARRARRLLPAAALALIVTLLLGAVILAPNEIVNAGRAARATALYLSNMFFARNAADYFAADVSTNPMLHTWSLGVEEQFYLFWPLLIVVGLRFLRSKRSLLALMALLTVASLAACLWLTANRGALAFYALPARAWEFGLGGLAILLPLDKLRVPAIAWVALGWLGVIGILASAYLISGATPFPGWTAAAPVLATVAALIGCAHQPTRGANLLLGSPPLQTLGTLSVLLVPLALAVPRVRGRPVPRHLDRREGDRGYRGARRCGHCTSLRREPDSVQQVPGQPAGADAVACRDPDGLFLRHGHALHSGRQTRREQAGDAGDHGRGRGHRDDAPRTVCRAR